MAVAMTNGESGRAPTLVNCSTISDVFMPGSVRSRNTRSGFFVFRCRNTVKAILGDGYLMAHAAQHPLIEHTQVVLIFDD